MGKLYPRHEKQTKNPAETTGNRYKIEILMSWTQKLKGLSAASLRLKTVNGNPNIICFGTQILTGACAIISQRIAISCIFPSSLDFQLSTFLD